MLHDAFGLFWLLKDELNYIATPLTFLTYEALFYEKEAYVDSCLSLAEMLIDAGANIGASSDRPPNQTSCEATTLQHFDSPLITVISEGRRNIELWLKVVNWLLEHEANIHQCDSGNKHLSALVHAVMTKQPGIVKTLIEAGAKLDGWMLVLAVLKQEEVYEDSSSTSEPHDFLNSCCIL